MTALENHHNFIDAKQVAILLAVPESWVREMTRRNLIPHRRLGKYRRYLPEEVLAWVETLHSGPRPCRKLALAKKTG